jgi:hypothetical protein
MAGFFGLLPSPGIGELAVTLTRLHYGLRSAALEDRFFAVCL